jgi:hypothetical protein
MPEAQTDKAVKLLDLVLEFFADGLELDTRRLQ